MILLINEKPKKRLCGSICGKLLRMPLCTKYDVQSPVLCTKYLWSHTHTTYTELIFIFAIACKENYQPHRKITAFCCINWWSQASQRLTVKPAELIVTRKRQIYSIRLMFNIHLTPANKYTRKQNDCYIRSSLCFITHHVLKE